MTDNFVFDQELINRYDRAGPRYTSYPTAVEFHDEFTIRDLLKAEGHSKALSLYFHIPFCDTVCFYCACNKIATKDRSKVEPYLKALEQEMLMQANLLDWQRPVEQLHWGGGTPTFLSDEQMVWLMSRTKSLFNMLDNDEGQYSIEIDPREVSPTTLRTLREIGFNRLSLGLQDLDERVQVAVNRVQSAELTFGVMQQARELGFKSVSLDLIYGLPHQSWMSFEKTLDEVIEARPDRLSVFNYAHMPTRFKPQRRINEADLPSAADKLEIMHKAGEKLQAAGYVFIGMDHFALPGDELALAQEEGHLHRNFQGYTTHAHCDLLAFGVSSIGNVGNTFSQNVKTLDEYYAAIEKNTLPIERGLVLNRDDVIRQDVITQLICQFALNFNQIDLAWRIQSSDYFAHELIALEQMQKDGLLVLSEDGLQVTQPGRLLIRNICMVFDRYLPEAQHRFSRAI
ncbi:MAG: oxygen-independent coproporphyrinogen III oxidase [Sedimenticolaceae bacterium]